MHAHLRKGACTRAPCTATNLQLLRDKGIEVWDKDKVRDACMLECVHVVPASLLACLPPHLPACMHVCMSASLRACMYVHMRCIVHCLYASLHACMCLCIA